MIADRPDSAYEVCSRFAPDCTGQPAHSVLKTERQSPSPSNKKGKKTSGRNVASSDQASKSNTRKRNQNDRSHSIRNLDLLSSSLKFNSDAALVSRDNSAESDGLGGVGFHGEEDYYDSLNSGDENEPSTPRPNGTRSTKPPEPGINYEPVYNPEPGINSEPLYNPEPGINYETVNNPEPGINNEPVFIPESEMPESDSESSYKDSSSEGSSVSNTSVFSTVVNGVKIKSLPGPRGI